jgi:hypothetical protein
VKPVYLPLWFVVLLAAGCVTHRDRVAVVRGAKFAAAEGSATGKAVAAEMGQVAIDIGADDIDPAGVPVTPEAAAENARGIAEERGNREFILDGGGSLLRDLLNSLPYGGTIAGIGGALWALWRKGQVQRVAGALSGVLDACRAGTYKDGDTAQALADAGADPKLAETIRQAAKG